MWLIEMSSVLQFKSCLAIQRDSEAKPPFAKVKKVIGIICIVLFFCPISYLSNFGFATGNPSQRTRDVGTTRRPSNILYHVRGYFYAIFDS